MLRWLQAFLLLTGITISTALFAAPSNMISDELDTADYDVNLTVTLAKNAPATATLRITQDRDNSGKQYSSVTLTRTSALVESVTGGKAKYIDKVPATITPGKAQQLSILRRGKILGVMLDGALIYRGEVPRPAGNQAWEQADKGWTVNDSTAQRMEPVAFSDNFMRTADETGEWKSVSGTWKLCSALDDDPHFNVNIFDTTMFAQNPFAWAGRAAGAIPAFCTTGQSHWEDYTISVAVRSSSDTIVGVAVNAVDAKNYLLVRWSAANDRSPAGDKISLHKVVNGKSTLLKSATGGFVPGQWYKISVSSNLAGIRVKVDERELLSSGPVTPWRGGVGLYVEGKNFATFDDVTVYGSKLKTDLIVETQMSRISKRFLDDLYGMKEWATGQFDWKPGQSAGSFWSRHEVYGDQWMSIKLKQSNAAQGIAQLTLQGDGNDLQSGLRAVLEQNAATKQLTYSLFAEKRVLKTKTAAPLNPGEEYSIRLWHIGNKAWLEVDGEKVLEANDIPAMNGRSPAYQATGCFSASEIVALGRNMLDYPFTDAPVDWISQGTWQPTTRWACAPQWSFLAGWSRGDAVLWHKKRFTGDHSFEAYVSLKMEFPREREVYEHRYRDFAITICGDGKDPRNGYTGIYAKSIDQKNTDGSAVLMRNGEEIGRKPFAIPNKANAHREWFDLQLIKHGDTVEFWAERTLVASFTDPEPITGGIPAIWIPDNGIMVARAKIDFANPPETRTDPQVIIDQPSYPEWINISEPFSLDFSASWSTTGKRVNFIVTPKAVPAGDETAATFDGDTMNFTPKQVGEHWYQFLAKDDVGQSFPYEFSLPVFDPSLKRDDSNAVVLYRFDEGDGQTVHDYGKISPAADIKIPAKAATRWIPGQGLNLSGSIPLMTTSTVPKLMSIARNKTCSIEFWVSTDTLFPPNPPTGWLGCLLTWEMDTNNRNFAVGHYQFQLVVATRSKPILGGENRTIPDQCWNLKNSLQHRVITWDGRNTKLYINGVKHYEEKNISWGTENWNPDALLMLGNQADGQHGYLGTFYLVAIHDKALSGDEVSRHYKAGPSAK